MCTQEGVRCGQKKVHPAHNEVLRDRGQLPRIGGHTFETHAHKDGREEMV